MARCGLCLLVLLVALTAYQLAAGEYYDHSGDGSGMNVTNLSNLSDFLVPEVADCVLGLVPCSLTITGNLILIAFYGVLLGAAAKMISDGAELLLDLGLPAAIIGGIVLPLLGAVPDSAMIIASGAAGSTEEANQKIAVGMGTLAGSTIMLLTLPWLGGLILGRVDIIGGEGRDNKCSRFTLKSFFKQGVTVFPDVTNSAIVMLITAIPYLIVQGADWHFGASNQNPNQPQYIKDAALATFIICIIFFFLYLALQVMFTALITIIQPPLFIVLYSVSSKRRDALRREETMKRRVVKQFYLMSLRKFGTKPTNEADGAEEKEESKPILTADTQKKYAKVWRMHRGGDKTAAESDSEKGEHKSEGEGEKDEEDPKWLIILKSTIFLGVGVALVTVFSDPMVNALTSLASENNTYYFNKQGARGQYVPIPAFYLSFVITPFCSNASELVSSLIFASKKKKVNSSLTYSQLYGAATMNNTLCLGIFAALVYFRGLDWYYSAEVTVIILVEVAVGLIAIISGFGYRHTYILGLGFLVGALYFLSIGVIALLENVAHWK